MHKIFAKPLFLGKKVLFLPQCHSTNEELLSLARKFNEPEGHVVYTDHQEKGRGQRGNVWVDEPNKNILMSVLLKPSFLSPSNQYFLNLIIGLAAIDVLQDIVLNKTCLLKWPNDIYINDRKVGGILIESNLKGSKLEYSVLGVGINVNQNGFNLPNATSLSLEVGIQFDKLELMEKLLQYLEKWYLKLKSGKEQVILDAYHERLLWKDEIHLFCSDGIEFKGTIRGIGKGGVLEIAVNGTIKTFGLNELKFVM